MPYIAVFRVKDDVIEVLHIFHGAQDIDMKLQTAPSKESRVAVAQAGAED